MIPGRAEAAQQWQEQGYAIVDGLIPEADIDAAADDIARLYGGDTFDNYNQAKGFGDGSPEGKQFRASQFDGMRGFPFAGCPTLNALYVHPNLVAFARAALQDDDVRIYQAAAWGKWAGEINYEQPLHQDGNHSLLPPRMEPGFWHLETFLYLSDVDEDCAPPRLVPNPEATVPYNELYEHEIAATAKRGSLLAYRSDVWHRGSDFGRDDASRFVAVVAFRPASAEWFGYDAFPRLGGSGHWIEFVAGKTPDDLALFGIPRPGHLYWNAASVEAMGAKYPGLDMQPWIDALR
ncbi:MAG: phytanoyl-CoA dioxygenase family protein [Actinobacteria bacterium]|nr:phytanoyl-CoA dioxygenase family protein [Actinomycetota bacterium]MBV8958097.1 phytanoyl-CoA dioxygenase family protein [Actinomycetota bacterium]MBV9254828.1 phytanoyl-CoA dioxygenase family protein [Actinomycetota bacterium]MBV9665067.1 phytanoyl-CoA dioxygenase family protein [Actinomycetota bacterium]MBV9936404.1 phytanoyl-CoA dioxygenase family protein [Actinomycetota bacterium]